MIFENNEKLKAMVKDFKLIMPYTDRDIVADFDIILYGVDIDAGNIDAGNIHAGDIAYYAVCFAYESIKCKSISGRRKNSRHFALDDEIKIKEVESFKDKPEG